MIIMNSKSNDNCYFFQLFMGQKNKEPKQHLLKQIIETKLIQLVYIVSRQLDCH